MASTTDGTINIHGKDYKTVALRIKEFKHKYPDHRFYVELVSADSERVIMTAHVVDKSGNEVSRGWAEETRGSTNINKTSALENCETSAIGRALAFLDPELMGTQVASADEVVNAISNQQLMEAEAVMIDYNAAVREHFNSIAYIKNMLFDNNWSEAAEAESEIPHDHKVLLWRAPSKGGVWTTEERAKLKSDEMNAARKEFAL